MACRGPGVALAPPSGEADAGYDPAAARAALARAGYVDCFGMPGVTLLVSEGDDLSLELAQRIIATWEETLGCDGAFTIEEQGVYDLLAAAHEQRPDSRQPPRPGLILLGWCRRR